MNAHVQNAVDKTRDAWSRLGKVQRIAVVGVTALLFAVFAAFLLWVTRPDYRPLYTKLSPEDANRVVSMLQTEKISYRLEDNGATVLVPADSVYDLSLIHI